MRADLFLRPASDADARTIGQFINVCTTTYQGIRRSSERDALERLRQDGSDPAADSFLVWLREELVGFAHVWRFTAAEAKCFARTHPEATGEGVGSLLLEQCERRATEILAGEDGGRLTTTSWAADTHAAALMEARRYEPIRHFLKMTIEPAAVPTEAPRWPPGVRIRPFIESADEEAIYEAFRAAFAEHWGGLSETRDQWWHQRRDRKALGEFDPALWLLAVDDADQVVGFSLCEKSGTGERRIGRVAELGVVPASRGRGIGYALLVHSFQLLKEREAGEITLDVDTENVTSALRLYVKAGMTPHPSFTVWERDLREKGA